MTTGSIADAQQRINQAVNARREDIITLANTLWTTPELGFREVNTANEVARHFEQLGLTPRRELGITGMRVDLVSGRSGPTLALLAELDAVCLPEHPAADPQTGAAHACGHHAQLAALVGCAAALIDSGLQHDLDANLALIVTPAEEYIDLAYRRKLQEQKRITYLSGKRELLHLGVFDDIDLALMIHLAAGSTAMIPESMNGFLLNTATFHGKAAHAGLAPHLGINALNAASLATMALHVQRETFRDEDAVRLHQVITHGGDSLNIVPERVTMECKVRAKTVAALRDSQEKILRSLAAGALAVGGKLTVETTPGYLPLKNDEMLRQTFGEVTQTLDTPLTCSRGPHRGSSTDMGDISQVMPAIHAYIGGAEGLPHSTTFRVVDPEIAYLAAAKTLAGCAWRLLADGAQTARAILAHAEVPLGRDDYWAYMREHTRQTTADYTTGSR